MEYSIELLDLGLQGNAGKPEEDDPSVGEALLKDEFAEIAVGNEENPLILPGDGQHILIGKTVWVVTGDSLSVMSERSQVGNQSEISAWSNRKFIGWHQAESPWVALGKLPRQPRYPWRRQGTPARLSGSGRDGPQEAR